MTIRSKIRIFGRKYRFTAFRNCKFWKVGWSPISVFRNRYTDGTRLWTDIGFYFVMWTVTLGIGPRKSA